MLLSIYDVCYEILNPYEHFLEIYVLVSNFLTANIYIHEYIKEFKKKNYKILKILPLPPHCAVAPVFVIVSLPGLYKYFTNVSFMLHISKTF